MSLTLNDDLLLLILEFSDIRIVMVFAQVSQHFRALTQTTHVWRTLIRRLHSMSLIELPPEDLFMKYSIAELTQLLKRNAVGPQRWTEPSSQPPRPSRTIHVPINLKRTPQGTLFRWAQDIQLLVDGRHLVVSNTRHLELWDLSTGNRKHLLEGSVYGVQHLQHENALRVIILQAVPLSELEIIQIDIRTGESVSLYYLRLIPALQMGSPLICDRYVALLPRRNDGFAILLIDWHTDTFVLVSMSYGLNTEDPILVPGFLIITAPSLNGHEILVYSLASFTGYWEPLSTLNQSRSLSHMTCVPVAPVVREPVEIDGELASKTPSLTLAVHMSLLDADTFVVSLYASDLEKPPGLLRSPRAVFRRYRLSAEGWSLLAKSRTTPRLSPAAITYSGFSIRNYFALHVHRMGRSAPPVVSSSSVLYATLTPYGGTIIRVNDTNWVEVEYYH